MDPEEIARLQQLLLGRRGRAVSPAATQASPSTPYTLPESFLSPPAPAAPPAPTQAPTPDAAPIPSREDDPEWMRRAREFRLPQVIRTQADMDRAAQEGAQFGAPVLPQQPQQPGMPQPEGRLLSTELSDPFRAESIDLWRRSLQPRMAGGASTREQITQTSGGPVDPELSEAIRRRSERLPQMIEDLGAAQERGLQAQAAATREAVDREAGLIEQDRLFEQHVAAETERRMAQAQRLVDLAASGRINPLPQGVGGLIGGSIAIGLAGMAAGTKGVEVVSGMINQAIDRAMQAQLANQDIAQQAASNQMRLNDAFRQAMGDERAARLAYRAALLNNAAQRVQALAMTAMGEKVRREAGILAEQLRGQRDEALAAAQASAIQHVRTTTITPRRVVGPSPQLLQNAARGLTQIGGDVASAVQHDRAEERQRMGEGGAANPPPAGYTFLGPQGARAWSSMSPAQRGEVTRTLMEYDTLADDLRYLKRFFDESSAMRRVLSPQAFDTRMQEAERRFASATTLFGRLRGLGALSEGDRQIAEQALGRSPSSVNFGENPYARAAETFGRDRNRIAAGFGLSPTDSIPSLRPREE